MKEIIPNNSRYVPLTQQAYCCVPTCIQIIMLRHCIPLQSAEIMASLMKVVVSEDKKDLFWNLPYLKQRPKSGFWTSVSENKTINKMFAKLDIPLHAQINFIDNFPSEQSLFDYLQEAVEQDDDIILCYDFGYLFDTGKHSWHASVLDRVDEENKKVRFIDPESTSPKWQIVDIWKLYQSMKHHGSRYMAWCWDIKRI